MAKGYMHLLKKDTPFIWDEEAQSTFDKIKYALTHAPLLHPPNYTKDYILYLIVSIATITIVLVQETDDNQEHVVYYLSKSLADPETRYSNVEKLALATVIIIQQF